MAEDELPIAAPCATSWMMVASSPIGSCRKPASMAPALKASTGARLPYGTVSARLMSGRHAIRPGRCRTTGVRSTLGTIEPSSIDAGVADDRRAPASASGGTTSPAEGKGQAMERRMRSRTVPTTYDALAGADVLPAPRSGPRHGAAPGRAEPQEPSAGSVVGALRAFTSPIRRVREQRRHHRALVRALDAFRARYPRWIDSGLDLHLLRNDGAVALAAGDPEALASAWCNQFAYRDPGRRARDERLVLPVAEGFMTLWAEALRLI